MAGFFGRYEHSVDSKGRVILPAKFRPAFDAGAFLSQNDEGCLALWTREEFDTQMKLMQERAATGGPDERQLVRLWAAGTSEVEIDRQGRMAIPSHLRDFASLELEGDVLVTGAIDRIELWNPAVWARVVQPQESRLLSAPGDGA